MIDHYKILMVSKNASKETIKKAYKKLAMKHHPDVGGSHEEFLKITQSYNILYNDKSRSEYDSSFNQTKPKPQRRKFYDGNGREVSLDITITLKFELHNIMYGWNNNTFSYKTNKGDDHVSINLSNTIVSGTTIRFAGKGHHNSGSRGDLYVKILLDETTFKRQGLRDLMTVIEVDYIRATIGGIVKKDNFVTKETLVFKIPENVTEGKVITSNGNFGMPISMSERGVVYGVVKIVPPKLNKVSKEALKLVNEYIQNEEEIHFTYKTK